MQVILKICVSKTSIKTDNNSNYILTGSNVFSYELLSLEDIGLLQENVIKLFIIYRTLKLN